MSNQALITIETFHLSHVNGGGTDSFQADLNLPGRGGGSIRGSVQHSDYEECLATARRTANESYPDTRNMWQWITGAPDLNARRRADFERIGVRACGTPPGATQPSEPRRRS